MSTDTNIRQSGNRLDDLFDQIHQIIHESLTYAKALEPFSELDSESSFVNSSR